MSESWNLDRKPTTAERAVGIVSAALLSIGAGVFLWISIVKFRDVWIAVGSAALLTLFVFFLVRFSLGKAEKLGTAGRLPRSELAAIARFIIAVSLALLVLAFFAPNSRTRFALLGLGCTGLAGGISNLVRARKEPNQAAQTTPGSCAPLRV
jgi:hypothetical protein